MSVEYFLSDTWSINHMLVNLNCCLHSTGTTKLNCEIILKSHLCIGGIIQIGVVVRWEVHIVLKLDLEEQKPVTESNKITYASMIVNIYWILFGIWKQILIYVVIYFHWFLWSSKCILKGEFLFKSVLCQTVSWNRMCSLVKEYGL